MIPFNRELLHVKHVLVKSCTTALGGSITIVDEQRSNDTKEVYTRCPIPFAVARTFIIQNKTSRFIKPIKVAVVYYDHHAVMMERQPVFWNNEEEQQAVFEKVKWKSTAEEHIEKRLLPLTEKGNWYIDGSYVYKIDDKNLTSATLLSSDGLFRSVIVNTIKLAHLSFPDFNIEERTCLYMVSKNGKTAISPPVWKKFSIMHRASDEDENTNTF
jgi:hypothetical protein